MYGTTALIRKIRADMQRHYERTHPRSTSDAPPRSDHRPTHPMNPRPRLSEITVLLIITAAVCFLIWTLTRIP